MFGHSTNYTLNGTEFNNVKDYAMNCDETEYILFKRRDTTTGNGFWFEGVFPYNRANEVAHELNGYGYETCIITVAEFFANAE